MTAAPRLYLLDIEGTIAPLSLTSEVLFPYARAHFEEFLLQGVAEYQSFIDRSAFVIGQTGFGPAEMGEGSFFFDLMMLKMECMQETDPDAPRMWPAGSDPATASMSPAVGVPRVLAYVNWLMDRDRKSTALKSMQGKIWKRGFESGELKGTIFDDVPAALAGWKGHARTAIYSSGSAEAQELFFRYSTHGNLTRYITGYFDTRTGPKGDPASYVAIAEAMEVAPAEVLFISDAVKELDAAREAGCRTRLAVRPGNPPIADAHGHSPIESFATL